MTIKKLYDGSYRISCIVLNHLFERRYFGYTKKEAVSLFKRDIISHQKEELKRTK